MTDRGKMFLIIVGWLIFMAAVIAVKCAIWGSDLSLFWKIFLM